ncbi:MAG: glycosyltransferase [Acidobacteria bacterium]|nr:glycosyltransferase [Acidobacteriota bacterium]
MNPIDAIRPVEWFFLLYFIFTTVFYMLLNYLAVLRVFAHLAETALEKFSVNYTGLEPPISLLVPAFNEEKTIATTVYSLLQLEYPEHEIVVVNDGSTDGTLETLLREFECEPTPDVYRRDLDTEEVHATYRSRTYRNLRVIDKTNGGKADALNAAINVARFPLFCSIDADSILERRSLSRVVLPFIEDSRTVAVGGTVRIANGCKVEDGMVIEPALPTGFLPLFQIVEYLRAFLFGRMGWAQINSLLVVSGAFGLFHRATVVEVGGYDTQTLGEDMELTVRMHRILRAARRDYRITFVPEPICWTEVPEDLRTLRIQRARWQRGLSESLWSNRRLLFHPQGGAAGWVGFPFMVLVEWLSPIVEVFGYAYMFIGLAMGWVDLPVMLVFLAVAVGFGTLLSVMGLVLEEMSFKVYSHAGQMVRLFAIAVIENFGFRQLMSVYRLIGTLQWIFGARHNWGDMQRRAPWGPDGSTKISATDES